MDLTLIAETGRITGSRSSKRLRAQDKVPGVVYGLDLEPVSVLVDRRELRRALNTEAGLNALITLDVDGHEDLTIVKEFQRHAVRRTLEHVDFLRVDRNVSITVEVPITLVGEAKDVEQNQGIVEQLLHALTVQSRPGAIPSHLEADISDLTIGSAVRVGDLTLPTGVSTEVDPEEQIALGSVTRAAMAEDEAEEGAGEAGGEAAADAGDANAAGE
jgi:large subunit ribosomal protein L25